MKYITVDVWTVINNDEKFVGELLPEDVVEIVRNAIEQTDQFIATVTENPQ